MAGLTPQNMSALVKNLQSSSPPANSRTPNNRKAPKEEFLERLNAIKALLKHIEDNQLTQDDPSGTYQFILDRFKNAVLQMQLSADGAFIVSQLGAAFGGGAPMGGQPGVPAAAPTPAPVPGPQMPPQAPAGNSPLNPAAV
jgi:hypothetical protein